MTRDAVLAALPRHEAYVGHRCRTCGQPITDVLTYVDVPGRTAAHVLARTTLDRTGAAHRCPTPPKSEAA